MGQLKDVRLRVAVEGRDDAKSSLYLGRIFDVRWGSQNRFRIGIDDYWGDSREYVCDGKTVMRDFRNLDTGVELTKFQKSAIDSVPDLAARGSYALATLYLLGGKQMVSMLAPPDASVVSAENRITIVGSPFGQITIHYAKYGDKLKATRIEYDNRPWKQSMFEQYPEWWDPPSPGTLDVETISWLRTGVGRNPFQIKPPKGLPVSDLRKG